MALGHRNYRKIRSRNRRKKPRRKKGMWPFLLAAVGLWVFTQESPWPPAFSSFPPAKSNLPIEDYSPSDVLLPEDAPEEELVSAGEEVSEAVLPQGQTSQAQANVAAIQIDGNDGSYPGAGTVYYKNETDYQIDMEDLLNQNVSIPFSLDEPAVLIVHTHGSEAYTPDAANWYTPTDTDRTTDTNYNVVRVGAEMEKILNEKGIKTIHATVLCDSPSYNGAYNRALEVIQQAISENPSIKFVIDVHRDAMITSSGKKYKTVAQIGGRQAAQLMLVAGTDGGGLTFDDWPDHLALAAKIQQQMNALYPGIMRPINVRAARFNQHVTPGSMLLEVGTSGNSLDEALYSASLFADALGDMLLDIAE